MIATDAATAADAAEEVLVDWEPLPAVAGVEQALEADATVLFDEMESNSQERWRRKVGDVEAATIGSTPAIVNAVMDALKPLGVRHLDMPLTPEKIWQAIHTNGTAAD